MAVFTAVSLQVMTVHSAIRLLDPEAQEVPLCIVTKFLSTSSRAGFLKAQADLILSSFCRKKNTFIQLVTFILCTFQCACVCASVCSSDCCHCLTYPVIISKHIKRRTKILSSSVQELMVISFS